MLCGEHNEKWAFSKFPTACLLLMMQLFINWRKSVCFDYVIFGA